MALKKGVPKSLKIAELQARLNTLSYPTGLVDAEFDEQTHSAVIAFQRNHNLVVDGIAGKNTWAKLFDRTEGKLLFLFIHCSASPAGMDFNGAWIKRYHMQSKGWSRPGYSDVICLNGRVDNIYPWDIDDTVDPWEYTFGTRKLNKASRHFCYIGGVDADDTHKAVDTRTRAQKYSMELYINFHLLMYPDLIIVGHNQVQRKACPSFDVPKYLKSIDVSATNVAHWGKLYK